MAKECTLIKRKALSMKDYGRMGLEMEVECLNIEIVLYTRVPGKEAWNGVRGPWHTLQEISIKASGEITKEMVMAQCTGWVAMKNTQATGMITFRVDLEHTYGLKVVEIINCCVIDMSVTGNKALEMAREHFITLMEASMRVNGKITLRMGMECSHLRMELATQVPLRMIEWLIVH